MLETTRFEIDVAVGRPVDAVVVVTSLSEYIGPYSYETRDVVSSVGGVMKVY